MSVFQTLLNKSNKHVFSMLRKVLLFVWKCCGWKQKVVKYIPILKTLLKYSNIYLFTYLFIYVYSRLYFICTTPDEAQQTVRAPRFLSVRCFCMCPISPWGVALFSHSGLRIFLRRSVEEIKSTDSPNRWHRWWPQRNVAMQSPGVHVTHRNKAEAILSRELEFSYVFASWLFVAHLFWKAP